MSSGQNSNWMDSLSKLEEKLNKLEERTSQQASARTSRNPSPLAKCHTPSVLSKQDLRELIEQSDKLLKEELYEFPPNNSNRLVSPLILHRRTPPPLPNFKSSSQHSSSVMEEDPQPLYKPTTLSNSITLLQQQSLQQQFSDAWGSLPSSPSSSIVQPKTDTLQLQQQIQQQQRQLQLQQLQLQQLLQQQQQISSPMTQTTSVQHSPIPKNLEDPLSYSGSTIGMDKTIQDVIRDLDINVKQIQQISSIHQFLEIQEKQREEERFKSVHQASHPETSNYTNTSNSRSPLYTAREYHRELQHNDNSSTGSGQNVSTLTQYPTFKTRRQVSSPYRDFTILPYSNIRHINDTNTNFSTMDWYMSLCASKYTGVGGNNSSTLNTSLKRPASNATPVTQPLNASSTAGASPVKWV